MQKLRFGVFEVHSDWKFYSEAEGARTFGDRASAVEAAETAARDALARGCEVELHLQDVYGELSQADLIRLAH